LYRLVAASGEVIHRPSFKDQGFCVVAAVVTPATYSSFLSRWIRSA